MNENINNENNYDPNQNFYNNQINIINQENQDIQDIQHNQNSRDIFAPQDGNVIVKQKEGINTTIQINNQENQNNEQFQISYEKNKLVMSMVGSKSLAKNNKEKTKPNQYSLVDMDDPELFDGKINVLD